MIESAARRDRVDSSFASRAFLWEIPEKPVSVSLTFDLIDRMEREVVEGFRSLTSRGSEIGGLLLGRAVEGSSTRIFVEDYQTVECDYSRGPLYRLSDADLGRLERVTEQRAANGGLEVVGFFRSHTRKGLTLDAEDLAFLEAHFGKPIQITLLVRPFATKASVAGIFIREDGAIRADSSYQEFPFRSSQLSAWKTYAAPPSRAQIVPIASRREINLAPVEKPPAPVAIQPEPAQLPVAVPLLIPKPLPEAAEIPLSLAPPEPQVVAPPPRPEPSQPEVPQPEPSQPEVPLPKAFEPPEPQPRNRRLALLVGLVAALAMVLVALFAMSGWWRSVGGLIPGSRAEADSLNLRAERTGADLLLSWNRDSAAIQNSSHAVLAIADGGRQETYEMDLAQLRTGSIVYAPLTADVSFRLDLTMRDRRTVTATVRMLRTRPSPMPEESQASAPAVKQSTAAPASAANPPDIPPVDPDGAGSARPNMGGSPVKPFDASSLAARLRPVRPADQPDLGSLGGGVPVTPRVSTDSALPFAALSPAPAPPPPPAPERKAEPLNVGGQIQPAELISRREPVYPSLARQTGTYGVVELLATIGTDGHVKGVKVVRGAPVLARAATEAVMEWVYRPTLLNGVPVTNESRITLNFTGR